MGRKGEIRDRRKDESESESESEGEGEDEETVTLDSDTFKDEFVIQKYIPGKQPKSTIFSTRTVYGKRKTGKSVFLKWDIQAYLHEIPWAWVFTLTKFNSHYASFIPKKFIMDSFSAGVLLLIMKRQELALKKYLKDTIDGVQSPKNPISAVIWDDYMGNDVRFNKMLHRYYYTGRFVFICNPEFGLTGRLARCDFHHSGSIPGGGLIRGYIFLTFFFILQTFRHDELLFGPVHHRDPSSHSNQH